ncbi:hypothetical protein [Mycolicibacter algericus]|uniref:Uncharacterized protein n=2 Tax=Mycolicibacter algericus TaxID=1288388 RepID=A0A7I9Y5C1_MYCAL|nr:hypothetical protein [Mycolicibacter algericus]OQZ94874.1 hypothetical protein BST10_17265 [Mycolicibacter algericus DSM 45454]GFG83878.1 hypothetical protein MALGJ_05540 [Mycolicibacter algericus]
MTEALLPQWTLVVMAVVEVIYVVAASLWILVVLTALGIGCYLMVKFRKSRRRMNRLFGLVRVPVQFGAHAVVLLRRYENVGRSYGATARDTVGPRLQMLISESRSDRRAALCPGSRRR